jgi:hypothetical protein
VSLSMAVIFYIHQNKNSCILIAEKWLGHPSQYINNAINSYCATAYSVVNYYSGERNQTVAKHSRFSYIDKTIP